MSDDRDAVPSVPWTGREKLALLTALRKHGPEDPNALGKFLPTRSPSEIRRKVRTYRDLAKRPSETSRRPAKSPIRSSMRHHKSFPSGAVLDAWARLTSESGAPESAFPAALRLIAHLERHPEPDEVGGVDRKALYLYLADLFDGKTPDPPNVSARELLLGLIRIQNSKAKRERTADEIRLLENVTRIFPDGRHQPEESAPESRALNRLLKSPAYNPLAVTENYLRNNDADVKLCDST